MTGEDGGELVWGGELGERELELEDASEVWTRDVGRLGPWGTALGDGCVN